MAIPSQAVASFSNKGIPAYRNHRSDWENFHYVYPVVSRRVQGISVGINLNPDKQCNFNCVYCQVDRHVPAKIRSVDLDVLKKELVELLQQAQSGKLFLKEPFASTPPALLQVRDIAFAGDGEPTSSPLFYQAIEAVAEIRRLWCDPSVKLILITNSSCLDRPDVRKGLSLLDANQGEIWAKLDAGTEEYYQNVNDTAVPFDRILKNIRQASRKRSLCIQSLFLQVHGKGPSDSEIHAYCNRLNELVAAKSKIKKVQIYTVTRSTAEVWATALPKAELVKIGKMVQEQTNLFVECHVD